MAGSPSGQASGEQPLSPLNQGLNPLRGAPLWGQLVALPVASPVIDPRTAPVTQAPQPSAAAPVQAPLWLALQPYANARLCLFEVDRPESQEPVPIRRHVLDAFLRFERLVGGSDDTALTDPGDVRYSGFLCRAATLPLATGNTFDWLAREQDWGTPGFRDGQPLPWDPERLGTVVAPCEGVIWLGDLALLQSEGVLPDEPRAQFAGCLVQHFGARYGSGGIGLLTQPLLGEAIELILKPHSVLVLRSGDTLSVLADRYGTTVQTLRRHNPHLASTQTHHHRRGRFAAAAGRSPRHHDRGAAQPQPGPAAGRAACHRRGRDALQRGECLCDDGDGAAGAEPGLRPLAPLRPPADRRRAAGVGGAAHGAAAGRPAAAGAGLPALHRTAGRRMDRHPPPAGRGGERCVGPLEAPGGDGGLSARADHAGSSPRCST